MFHSDIAHLKLQHFFFPIITHYTLLLVPAQYSESSSSISCVMEMSVCTCNATVTDSLKAISLHTEAPSGAPIHSG